MPVPAAVLEGWGDVATKVGDLKSDRVAAVLEHQILSGALAPGTVLPIESELVDILGVSRTVVRDAVRTLVARGLLYARQGRGTIVAEPNSDAFANAMVALLARSGLTMGEVMQSRAILETLIVGIAAQASTEEDWKALEDAYEALRAAAGRGDTAEANLAHAAFHNGILQATHQKALALMLTPMSEIATLTGGASVRSGFTEDWEVEAHLPILEAIKRRDPDAAAQAMRAHFEVSMRPSAYQEFLDQPFAEGYFSPDL
jgi:DNA-binding FadR family transcriptional regulator